MTLQTDRLTLPLMAAAQAQKEMTHNEALALLDIAVQPVVEAVAPAAMPTAPQPGQCWIVGTAATGGAAGAWVGHDGAIAAWTQGGWRFVAPFTGMSVWSRADQLPILRTDAGWSAGTLTARTLSVGGQQVVGARSGAIATPAAGATIDVEGRTAIAAILDALVTHGLIAA